VPEREQDACRIRRLFSGLNPRLSDGPAVANDGACMCDDRIGILPPTLHTLARPGELRFAIGDL
jgi:hypothetical protein